jgi:hypothetical protein
MGYDRARGAVVIFRLDGKAEERGIFVYAPAANALTTAAAESPRMEWNDNRQMVSRSSPME